jgi:hypothetical protein
MKNNKEKCIGHCGFKLASKLTSLLGHGALSFEVFIFSCNMPNSNFASCLYGCETWSLNLREKHRLRVFKNRLLRKIFGPKMEEDGSWRKLHNDELRSLYSSLNILGGLNQRG